MPFKQDLNLHKCISILAANNMNKFIVIIFPLFFWSCTNRKKVEYGNQFKSEMVKIDIDTFISFSTKID